MNKLFDNIYSWINNTLFNLKKKFPLLKRVTIEVTSQCNLKCKHCYMDSKPIKNNDELTKEDYYKIAERLKVRNGIEIVFTWWEPLMNEDFEDILKKFDSLNFSCFLVTNGTLLTEEKFLQINCFLSWISISLDWFKEYHDSFRWEKSFDIIVKNIQYVINNWDKEIYIKTVVTKENIWELNNFKNFIIWLWVKKWHLITLSNKWRWEQLNTFLDNNDLIYLKNFIKENADIEVFFDNPLEKELKKCICWIEEFSILYNWDIVACLNADRNTVKKYWNIKNDDVLGIRNKAFKEYRDSNFYNCNN